MEERIQTIPASNTDSVLGFQTNEKLKRATARKLWLTRFVMPWRYGGTGIRPMKEFMKHWKDGYVVPGLRSCANGCSCMVPQGICIAGRYLVVTAYCGCTKQKGKHFAARVSSHLTGKHTVPQMAPDRHVSVLFLLEKATGAYVKTILLPDKNHVGGVTSYQEGDAVYIVVTGRAGKKGQGGAQLQRYALSALLQVPDGGKLENYVNRTEIIPTKLDHASFVSYHAMERRLYVGKFHAWDHKAECRADSCGKMQTISTEHPVWLEEEHNGKSVAQLKVTDSYVQEQLPDNMQGCDFIKFSGNPSILLSCSYGYKRCSVLSLHAVLDGIVSLQTIESMQLPPYLEEIAVDEENRRLYLLFESGSVLYSWKTPVPIDRIVVLQY